MTAQFVKLGWKAVAAATLFSFIGVADAYAASCKQKDLKGEWLVEFGTEGVCEVKIDKYGRFEKGPCEPRDGDIRGNANGRLIVDAKCKVTGKLNIAKNMAENPHIDITAKMNQGKDLIAGKAKSQFGSAIVKMFLQ